jgi:hypothetical protein
MHSPGGLRIRLILRQNRLQTHSWLGDRSVLAVGFGCGILLGWRAFLFEGVTYDFYIDEYLVMNNKIHRDEPCSPTLCVSPDE